jgi:hypothetical protein
VGRSVRESMRPLILRDGQVADGIDIALFHGGVIAGRILDAHGDPVEFAEVRAIKLAAGAAHGMSPRASNQSNDIGEFRIPRLEPAKYLVMVVPRRSGMEEPIPDGDLPPQPFPTYYPGVASVDQAQPIAIDRGQPASQIDIVLGEGTPTIVTGMLIAMDGRPIAGHAFLNARSVFKGGPAMYDTGTSIRPDGTFRFSLPPGEYDLEAHGMNGPNGRPAPGSEQMGTTRVSISGPRVDGITIVLGPGATATGRVIFEGTTPPPAPPSTPELRVPLMSIEGSTCRSGQAQIASDWTFKVDGLAGTCSAPPTMFGRWTVKAVLHGDQDLLEHPVRFEPGRNLRNVQVVVTDRRTELGLHVSDDQGQTTRDYVAIVFPTAKDRWEQSSRYVRTYTPLPLELLTVARGAVATDAPQASAAAALARTEQVTGLPAGEYYVIAVDDIESERARDPEIFEHLIASAARVTVDEGKKAEVTLRRVKLAAVVPDR